MSQGSICASWQENRLANLEMVEQWPWGRSNPECQITSSVTSTFTDCKCRHPAFSPLDGYVNCCHVRPDSTSICKCRVCWNTLACEGQCGELRSCYHIDHKVIARVHSVHLMNVEQCQAAVNPQTKPCDLGCEFACRQLSSTTTITIYYYYSARKLILIYRPTEGRRLSWPTE